MRALQQSDGYVRCKIIKKKVDLINKKEFLRFLLFESIKAFCENHENASKYIFPVVKLVKFVSNRCHYILFQ